MSRDDVVSWLRGKVADAVGTYASDVDPDVPFERFGLEPVDLVSLAGELGEYLGRELPSTILVDCPTPMAVAAFVATEAPPRPAPVAARSARAAEALAIVGIGCRFPGGSDPRQFWQALRDGRHLIRDVPNSRWAVESYYDPQPGTPGKTNSRWGGFIERVTQFDFEFFGISRREAELMDPQQRILLELAWETLWDAGVPPQQLAGTRAGVFIGMSSSEYAHAAARDLRTVTAYTATGNSFSIAANRLSYFLDCRGPSLTVDTACSASLVALHLACRSVATGEAEVALAGGISLSLTPLLNISMTMGGVASPTGRCRPFADDADGIVRGEGAGLVLIKPLARALADGDRIYCLVRGSALSQDGRSSGLVVPSGRAQEEAIRQAYVDAGIDPQAVDYVECHGTGTVLGDPIEAEALGRVVGPRAEGTECRIGSLKANIGHLEAAAGIAGLIKTALALYHGVIPPGLPAARASQRIPFAQLGLRLIGEPCAWRRESGARVAGVSAFGFGGTNAHVVLTDCPATTGAGDAAPPSAAHILPLSAHTPAALRTLAHEVSAQLATSGADGLELGDLCYTAARRRPHQGSRVAVAGETRPDLLRGLEAYLRGSSWSGMASGTARRSGPTVMFVFSGHGGQWWGMGRELLAHEPVFRHEIEMCSRSLERRAGWSLLEELRAPEDQSRLRTSDLTISQAAIFGLQAGLVALFRSWGIEPDGVVGHSIGEVAAAYAAGCLALEEAVEIIVQRGRLMEDALRSSPHRGAMATVEMDLGPAESLLEEYRGRLSVAAYNGPRSVVISGEEDALDDLLSGLVSRDVYWQKIEAPGAGHSPQLTGVGSALAASLSSLRPRAPRVDLFSTVTGGRIAAAQHDGAYWGQNLHAPVLFAPAIAAALRQGYEAFVEIGPHPLLAGALQRCVQEAGSHAQVIRSLVRHKPERAALFRVLATLFAGGGDVRWDRIYPAGRVIALPPYPWNGSHCWLEAPATDAARGAFEGDDVHPLLGLRWSSPALAEVTCWEGTLDFGRFPFLQEHCVDGAPLVPTTFYLALGVAAARAVLGTTDCVLTDVSIDCALFLDHSSRRAVQVIARPEPDGAWAFEIFSRPIDRHDSSKQWTRHVRGRFARDDRAQAPLDPPMPEAVDAVDVGDHYRSMQSWGVDYGPTFRGLQRLQRSASGCIGHVRLLEGLEPTLRLFPVHPCFLDACLQTAAAAVPDGRAPGAGTTLVLPVALARFTLRGSAPRSAVSVATAGRIDPSGTDACVDVRVYREDGELFAAAEGFRVRAIAAGETTAAVHPAPVYDVEWQPYEQTATGPAPLGGEWLVVSEDQSAGSEFAPICQADGLRCSLVDLDSPQPIEAQLRVRSSPPPQHIAFFVGAPPEDDHGRSPAEHVARACQQLTDLVRWAKSLPEPVTLWLVTHGAQAVRSGDPISYAGAAVWGLGRSLAVEQPALLGGLIDLDPHDGPRRAAERLHQLFSQGISENQIALRAEGGLVPRLAAARPTQHQPLALRSDATYLVTGGLGGVGGTIARWLVTRGARCLVLTGRTALPPRERWDELAPESAAGRRVAAVRELESHGCRVAVLQADAASAAETDALLRQCARDYPALRGVIHAAGVASPCNVHELDPALWDATLGAKALGALHLDRLTRSHDLDFFVLCSSASAIWGSALLGHYAAANHVLDAVAHQRRRRGAAALSVNWGMWGEVGMAASDDAVRAGQLIGLQPMAPPRALASLEQLIQRQVPHATVAAVDWDEFRPLFEFGHPERGLLRRLSGRCAPTAPRTASALLQRLTGSDRAAAVQSLAVTIRDEFARALGDDPSRLELDRPLDEFGLDSLAALHLKNHFEAELGIRIPVALVLRSPSIQELAHDIWQLVQRPLDESGAHLGEDAVLAADICAQLPPRPLSAPAPQQVLLTGATGFLGSAILARLLQRTDARVHCLVRAADAAQARERLMRTVARYHRVPPDSFARVTLIPGTLDMPRLGLDEATADRLADTIDAIYHSAAWLNPVYPYAELKSVNVDGTRELLRLAGRGRRKIFHHVSSLAVFPWDQAAEGQVYQEVETHEPIGLPNGYCQSKWVAERLVCEAGHRGLDIRVFRPGLVSGDSRSGTFNEQDLFCRFLKGCIQARLFPTLRGGLSLSPVDFVADALVHIALLADAAPGPIFHLTNPHWLRWPEVVECVRAVGFEVAEVPYEDWTARLQTRGDLLHVNVLHYLQPLFSLPEASFTGRRTFDVTNTARALSGSGVECPADAKHLLRTYLAEFQRVGFVN